MKRIKVQCTLIVELDWQDDWAPPDFVIEENGCPGTGSVGSAIDAVMQHCKEESHCWACELSGENKILSIKDLKWNGREWQET